MSNIESSLLGPGLGLDASAAPSQADLNLRTINQVQNQWRLPELPDSVKLDLATHPAISPGTLGNFLNGLSTDVSPPVGHNDSGLILPSDSLTVLTPTGDFQPRDRSGLDQFRTIWANLRNETAPTALSPDAVQQWKLDAINSGNLERPANGQVDGSWGPDLEAVRRNMAYQDVNDLYGGQGFGRVPLAGDHGVMAQLAKWTSPTGLLGAATKLDLWWDGGQITKEFSSWGDKWRKVGKSKNPLDFAGNLIDALTGPIDDIAVPVINWALLLSGVGEAFNFAKFAGEGARVAEGVEAAGTFGRTTSSLYDNPLGRLIRSPDVAAEFAHAQEPSMLATKLMRSEKSVVSGVGDALAKWRRLDTVTVGKKFLQTGMRLGITQQAEDLLPNYQGAHSAIQDKASAAIAGLQTGKYGTGIAIADGAAELLFQPAHIFEPGSFIGGGKSLVKFVGRNLGTIPGRAVAGGLIGFTGSELTGHDLKTSAEATATGAIVGAALPAIGSALEHVPGVGKLGSFLEKTSYLAIADDQRVSMAFHGAMRNYLTGPDLARYDANFAKHGFLRAYADQFHGGDLHQASANMAFMLVNASIDFTAHAQATVNGVTSMDKFLLARNKLISQIRSFDIEGGGDTFDSVLWAAVNKDANSRVGLQKQFEALKASVDPARAAEMAAQHNEFAEMTMRQLLSTENLPLPDLKPADFSGPGQAGAADVARLQPWAAQSPEQKASILQSYIEQTMPSFGNWTKYSTVSHELGSALRDGLLTDAQYVMPVSWRDDAEAIGQSLDHEAISNAITDFTLKDPSVNVVQLRKKGGFLMPFTREVNPLRGGLTPMLKDTPAKGELVKAANDLGSYQQTWRALTELNASKPGILTTAGDLRTLGDTQVEQLILDAGKHNPDVYNLKLIRDFAKLHDISTADDFGVALVHMMDRIDGDAKWQRFGQPSLMVSDDGKVLSGLDGLAARRKALMQRSKYTATEIDTAKLMASTVEKYGETSAEVEKLQGLLDHFDESGYKLVHGAEFLGVEDLAGRTGRFRDINERHMNAMTLGNFFSRRQPAQLAAKIETGQRASIAFQLSKAQNHGLKVLDDAGVLTPNSPDMDALMYQLRHNIIGPALEHSNNMLDSAQYENFLAKVSARAASQRTPITIQDLGLGVNEKRIIAAFKPIYGEEASHAIWLGIKKSRFSDWKDLGLAAVEQKMRARNQLMEGLHVLGSADGNGWIKRAAPLAVAGAIGGAALSDSAGGDKSTGAIVGGLGGALLGGGLGITKGITEAFDHSKWARYGYLQDNLSHLRDTMRFSLSPFFDLEQMDKSVILSVAGAPQYAEDGSRLALPLNMSPNGLRRKLVREAVAAGGTQEAGHEKWLGVQQRFRNAAKGDFDPNELDNVSSYFRQVGILGHDTTAWMSAAFYHLTEAGMDPEKAYTAVKNMYSYGVTGRSAAEQTANFIFFPFSFQKKLYSTMGKFIADDFSRATIIHDAYKTYEILNKHYDLNDWMKEHIPVMQELTRLNTFSHGLSPGKLGGINSPILEAGGGALLNLFSPQGVSVTNAGEAANLKLLARRLVPVWSDVDQMMKHVKETGTEVIFGKAHMTEAAQVSKGYDEWNAYKSQIEAALKTKGYTLAQLSSKKSLAQINVAYKTEKARIADKYPGWEQSIKDTSASKMQDDISRQLRLLNPQSKTDFQWVDFDAAYKKVQTFLDTKHISMDNAPTRFTNDLRALAVQLASSNPQFAVKVYDKFYRSHLGPLEVTI